MIRCLIIDDEPLSTEILQSYIAEFKNMEVVNVYGNAVDALADIDTGDIDVIFLDINMPRMTGLEFLRSLTIYPHIIITTAYKEHALESYELEVLDYLVKPIPFTRFLKSINKLTSRIVLANSTSDSAFNQDPHLFLKVDKKLVKIFLQNIQYIESLKDYIKVYCLDGSYMSHKSLYSISEELPSEQFVRVHKSFTISIDKVKSIEGNLLEIGTKKIPMGRNYAVHAKEVIFKNKGNLMQE